MELFTKLSDRTAEKVCGGVVVNVNTGGKSGTSCGSAFSGDPSKGKLGKFLGGSLGECGKSRAETNRPA